VNTTRKLTGGQLPEWVVAGVQKRPRVGAFDFMISTDLLPPKWNTDTHGEKFMDPWVTRPRGDYFGWGLYAGHDPYAGPDRDYLFNTPANGATRVDAMLEKIKGISGDTYVPNVEDLQRIGKLLGDQIDAEALKTRNTVERFWDYLFTNSGADSTFYGSALHGALNWVAGTFDPTKYGASGKAHALLSGWIDDAVAAYATSITEGIPYPWHAINALPIDVPKFSSAVSKSKDAFDDSVTAMQEIFSEVSATKDNIDRFESVAKSLQYNVKRVDTLPEEAKTEAIAWWGMLLSTLEDPFVFRAFHAMHGGYWGSMNMASDEQVMIVAASVAKVYQIDVRTLAIELWNRSAGWSASPNLAGQFEIGLSNDNPFDWRAETIHKSRIPTNATEAQWVDLSHNALVIADAIKNGTPIPSNLYEAWKARRSTTINAQGFFATIIDDLRRNKSKIGVYTVGTAIAGALGYFVTPWIAPIPLIGSWLVARKV